MAARRHRDRLAEGERHRPLPLPDAIGSDVLARPGTLPREEAPLLSAFESLAQALIALANTPIPEELIAKLRLHVADTLAAAVAGAHTPEGEVLSAFARMPPPPLPPSAGEGADVASLMAELARLTEADDIHRGSSTTPGAAVVPAALALGRALSVEEERLLGAILAGYEAMIRVGRAVDGAYLVYRGVWTSLLAAPVATAAVSGILLGLPREVMGQALALAAALSPRQSLAPPARWLAFGHAVRAGIVASAAVAAGVAHNPGDVEAKLFQSQDVPWEPARLTSGGQTPAFAEVSLKPYPAAKQAIGALEAAAQVLSADIPLAKVARVEVSLPPEYFAMVAHDAQPWSRQSSLTSVPYQLTLRLFERPALSDPRRGHRVESEPGAALRKKLHLKAEGGLSAFYPRFWPARCLLTTDDGSARVAEAMSQLGDPESPMDGSLLLAKWRDILAWVVPEEQGSLLLRHLERYLEGSLALAQIFAEAEQAMR